MAGRVLLADDNAALLAAAGRALREAGYLVTSTNNGADTVCLLGAKPPPDLVVLDVMMPGLDGYAVLRSLGPTAPPVVLMSGAPLDESQFDARKVSRVLAKPFDLTALLAAVAAVAAVTRPAEGPSPAGVPPTDERGERPPVPPGEQDGSIAVAGLSLVVLAAALLLRGWACLAAAVGIGG
jgi:two-component system OmpR family response regulator